MEVAGPIALFARPDTGGAPTSYPVPTKSAAKGIFEAIVSYNRAGAWIEPTRVEVCRRAGAAGGAIRFETYVSNYGGPLRKSDQLTRDNNLQLHASVVVDVCYRLHGQVRGELRRGVNPRHQLHEMFTRRLAKGQCLRAPSLGWKEFTCTYWGPLREGWVVDEEVSLEIPSMLDGMWDAQTDGRLRSRFSQELNLDKGVLEYGA
jgi:CRISPR-associated protein Cas5d